LAVAALDTTFDADGGAVVQFDDLGFFASYGHDVAVGADGRIFIAGSGDSTSTDRAAVAALLADGSPDPNFGNAGRVTHTTGYQLPSYFSVLAESTGRIIAAGYSDFFAANGAMLFSRYLANGQPDPSFGTGGHLALPKSGQGDVVNALAFQFRPPGPSILGAGTYNNLFAVARVRSDGTPDPFFSGDGVATVDLTGRLELRGWAYDVAATADNKIVAVGGGPVVSGGSRHPFIVRLTDSGALDTSFNVTGRVDLVAALGNSSLLADGELRSIALTSDGKIVVAGKSGEGSAGRIFIARLTSAGALDPSFSGDGIEFVADVQASIGADAAIESNGAILYTYSDYGLSSPDRGVPIVGRLTSSGAADATFGASGVFRITNPPNAGGGGQIIERVVLQSDGKAVLAGYDTGRMYVLRLQTNPAAPTPTLDQNGVLHIAGTSANDAVRIVNTFVGQIEVHINGALAGAFPFAQVQSIAADLLEGDDLLTLEQAVFAPLSYDGNAGRDSLIYRASNGSDNILINATHITSEANDATVANVEDLTVDAMSSTDSIIVDVGTDFAGTLRVDGNNQDDTFEIRSAPNIADLSILPAVQLIGGNGDDHFNFASINFAVVGVDGGPGADNIDFAGSAAVEIGGILESIAALGRSAAHYSTVEQIHIDADGGDDLFTLGGAKAGVAVTIDAGAGDDQFTFSMDQNFTNFHGSPINIIGGEGGDLLRASAPVTAGQILTITPTQLAWAGTGLNLLFDGSLEDAQLIGSGGTDRFDVTPSATMEIFINGLNPSTNPGDVIRLFPGGATGINHGVDAFTFNDRRPVRFMNIETAVIPQMDPPVVVVARFNYGNSQSLYFEFSEDVQDTLDLNDLVLRNLTTGATFGASSATSANTNYNMTAAWWDFGGGLPDGHYRASFGFDTMRDTSGDPLLPFSMEFDILKGDLNGDGQVTIADFITLSSNFGKFPADYGDGDVNYDNSVTIADFIALASNFGKSTSSFAAPAAPQPALSASSESLNVIERNRAARSTRRHHSHLIHRPRQGRESHVWLGK
jgi:uncharacterized delta-60 repeat protein